MHLSASCRMAVTRGRRSGGSVIIMTTTLDEVAIRAAARLRLDDAVARRLVAEQLDRIGDQEGRRIKPGAIAHRDANRAVAALTSARHTGGLGRDHVAQAKALHRDLLELQQRVCEVRSRRDATIRQAIAHGARVIDIARATGMSRTAVYQIHSAGDEDIDEPASTS